MPLYQFRCPVCGDFDESCRYDDRDKMKCPECGAPARHQFCAGEDNISIPEEFRAVRKFTHPDTGEEITNIDKWDLNDTKHMRQYNANKAAAEQKSRREFRENVKQALIK